jgi:ribosome maturation factor RimP
MIIEGNEDRSLLLFPEMNGEAYIQELEQKINDLLSPDPTLFLIEVKIKPTNNIKVFIDGDQGISIDKLVQYNRSLYRQIEGSGLFPNDDFSLEVSSPGLDEPLKLHRQYLKNIGRLVEMTEVDGTHREGKLLSATEKEIILEELIGKPSGDTARALPKGKKNKEEWQTRIIPFESIRCTKVQVKF